MKFFKLIWKWIKNIWEFHTEHIAFDMILFFFILAIMIIGWLNMQPPDPSMKNYQERQIALTTIQGAINSSITGVSIMLAAIAAVTGIRKELARIAKNNYRISATYCLISLFAGLWNMGVLPQLIMHNIAFDSWVGITLIIQIWMLFLGGFRLMIAIYATIK